MIEKTDAHKNYVDSDIKQLIRILQSYNLFKNPLDEKQLKLFNSRGKYKAFSSAVKK